MQLVTSIYVSRRELEMDTSPAAPAIFSRGTTEFLDCGIYFAIIGWADVKSAAQVALEAGNSPQMIFQHYRELVTEKGAKEWFAITPDSTKALREQAEKERRRKRA